jgi:uncharacterized protein DUF6438/carboxypeptidase family protein
MGIENQGAPRALTETRRSVGLLLFLLVGVLISACNSGTQTGAIEGNVSGASGAVIGQYASSTESKILAVPNVNVTIKNLTSAAAQTIRTDFNGNFRAEGLSPGRYEVSFAAKPFKQQVHAVYVKPDESTDASTRMLTSRDAEDFVAISGCPARPVGGVPPPKVSSLEIQLKRTACYGSCPAYRVHLSSDGRVEYEGSRYVAVVGARNLRVEPSVVAGLAKKFFDKGFFNFCASYRVPMTDQPTTETTINVGGVAKTVSVYGSSEPEGLEELDREIEQAANVTQFIKSVEPRN